ncbi:hypothetical protein [Mangrovivirga cuniculi]|uniref:Uncharacterized protein n=1 Tax=Mangrovivirga cuniculi TaxID=2715131 RepID=A0A4D7JKT3_9BACT|nr:hypothetical protein [Mangrovivirga cuniculi]QCK14090.1 hypothetical protein DCC35_04655 [Mangrovivirga cuniculi]
MDNSNLDKLFRDKLSTHESDPSPKAWEDLDKMLKQKKSKSKKRIFYRVAAAILFLGVASIVLFQLPEEEDILVQQTEELNIPQIEKNDEKLNTPIKTEELIADNTNNSTITENENEGKKVEAITSKSATDSGKQIEVANNTKSSNPKKINMQESVEQTEQIQTKNMLADGKELKNITEPQMEEKISDQSQSVTLTFGKVATKTTKPEPTDQGNLGEEQMWGDDSLLESLASDSKATNESKKIFKSIKNTTSQLLAFNGKNKNLETE